MPDKQKLSSLMAIFAACAAVIALVSFFLPFISIDFFGTHSISGLEMVSEILDNPVFPDIFFLLSALFTVPGITLALISIKYRQAAIGTTAVSVVGMIFMLIAMTTPTEYFGLKSIDYATTGFHLYIIASLAATGLSIAYLYLTAGTSEAFDFKKIISSNIATKITCPKCGKALDANATFCNFCGTKLSEKSEATPKILCPKCGAPQEKDSAFCSICGASLKATPPPPPPKVKCPHCGTLQPKGPEYCMHCGKSLSATPPPPPPPGDKVICPYCGAKHPAGTEKCKYCGTPITSNASTPSQPSGNKVICPHCGAKQPPENGNCKYCGTPLR